MPARAEAKRWPIGLSLCALMAGCQPTGLASLPPMPGRSSVLVALLASDLKPAADQLFAIDLVAPLPILAFPDQAEIWALGYDATLSDLGLSPGPVLKPPADASASLPTPQESLKFVAAWRAETFDEDLRNRLRIPGRGPLDCIARGGCATQEEGNTCPASCAVTQPELPSLPLAVDGPDAVPARVPCPSASVQDRLAADCRVIAPCPSGPWPDALPAGTWYVDSDQPVGGDGSLALPFASLVAAVASATHGDVIAFRGTGREEIYCDKSLTILGTCPEQSRWLPGTGPGQQGTLHVENGAHVRLEGLSIEGILYANNASISLSRVVVDVRVPSDPALWVDEGALSLEGVHVRTRTRGAALHVFDSTLDASGLVLEGGSALIECVDAHCRLRDSVLLGASDLPTETSLTSTRSLLTLDGVLFEDQQQALFASASTVSVTAIVIRRSGPSRAALELQRSLFEGQRVEVSDFVGSGLISCDGEIRIQDMSVAGAPPVPGVLMHPGVAVRGARRVQIERLRVTSTRAGLLITAPNLDRRANRCGQPKSEVSVSDVSLSDGRDGHAMDVAIDGNSRLERVLIERWGNDGLTLGKDTSTQLMDLSIDDVDGAGLTIEGSLESRLQRLWISNVRGIGIDVDLAQFVTKGETWIEQLTVSGTRPSPEARSPAGPALRLKRGQFKIERFTLHDNATGIELGALIDSELIDGQVFDNETGVSLLDRGITLPSFDRVQFRNNTVPVLSPSP